MIKHYIEWFYPGSFVSDSSSHLVEERVRPTEIPARAYAFRFYSRKEVELDGEVLLGEKRDFSGTTYFGEEVTQEQIVEQMGTKCILYQNMKCNGWKSVVRTIKGQYMPIQEGDTIEQAI